MPFRPRDYICMAQGKKGKLLEIILRSGQFEEQQIIFFFISVSGFIFMCEIDILMNKSFYIFFLNVRVMSQIRISNCWSHALHLTIYRY